MLLQKTGLPPEGELLLCTITKIQLNSVFVKIDEYNISGMIHISEISPGRIRNIRDFVREGKKVVCVVLRVHEDKGHVDLSLRRVNESQKKKKIESIKQQQKAEKIIEYVATQNKLETKTVYKEVMDAISKDYSDLVAFFFDVVNSDVKFATYSINKKYTKELEEAVRQRIKPVEISIQGEFVIECYKPDGIEVIKKAFDTIDPKEVDYYYLGGGRYHLGITATDYKEGEEHLETIKGKVIPFLEKNEAIVKFTRSAKKKNG